MRDTKRIREARELPDREWFRVSADERETWFGLLRAHAEPALAGPIPPHLDGVRARFLDRPSGEQLAQPAPIWRTLLETDETTDEQAEPGASSRRR